MMDEKDYAIEELAECVKELVRIFQIVQLPAALHMRCEKVYQKASTAKNRVQS